MLERHPFHLSEVDLGEIGLNPRLEIDAFTDDTGGGQRARERAGDERVEWTDAGESVSNPRRLLKSQLVQRNIRRADEEPINVGGRLPVPNEVQGGLTRLGVTQVTVGHWLRR